MHEHEARVKYNTAPLNRFGSSGWLLAVGKHNKEIALHIPITTPLRPQPLLKEAMILEGNGPAYP